LADRVAKLEAEVELLKVAIHRIGQAAKGAAESQRKAFEAAYDFQAKVIAILQKSENSIQ
jgi:hypothetical protein